MYDYRESVKSDIQEALNNGDYDYIVTNYTDEEWTLNESEKDDLFNDLYDDMWTDDSITGNGSGSYTFCTATAMENLAYNLDLLAEACEAFGSDTDVLKSGAEACDVTIRCYLLGECLTEVLDSQINN